MWWRKKKPEADLTLEAYGRWLRAKQPPLFWFMAQTQQDQEGMALLGDRYAERIAIDTGYAVQNPAAAESGVAAARGSVDAEADLLAQMIDGAFAKIAAKNRQATSSPAPSPKPSPAAMGGTGRKVPGVR